MTSINNDRFESFTVDKLSLEQFMLLTQVSYEKRIVAIDPGWLTNMRVSVYELIECTIPNHASTWEILTKIDNTSIAFLPM